MHLIELLESVGMEVTMGVAVTVWIKVMMEIETMPFELGLLSQPTQGLPQSVVPREPADCRTTEWRNQARDGTRPG